MAGRPGRRGADLGVHGTQAARQAKGLEAAVVDFEKRAIVSLDPTDVRVVDVAVAGVAALLVAKLHKIAERVGTKRAEDKDALDVVRLLRGSDATTVAPRLVELAQDARCSTVVQEAMVQLATLFATPDGVGNQMAGRAAFPAERSGVIAASGAILASELLRRV